MQTETLSPADLEAWADALLEANPEPEEPGYPEPIADGAALLLAAIAAPAEPVEGEPKAKRRTHTLPLEPLWNKAWMASGMPAASPGSAAELGYTAARFAEDTGFSVKAVMRWQESGQVPWVSADEASTAIGSHPAIVWGLTPWLNVKGDMEEILADEAEGDLMAYLAECGLD